MLENIVKTLKRWTLPIAISVGLHTSPIAVKYVSDMEFEIYSRPNTALIDKDRIKKEKEDVILYRDFQVLVELEIAYNIRVKII